MKWEPVNNDTDRLEVPGGWLYRVGTHDWAVREDTTGHHPEFINVSVVFVPAPQRATVEQQQARITALEQALKEAQEPCYCCRETGWDGRGCRDGCKCDAALTREVETP